MRVFIFNENNFQNMINKIQGSPLQMKLIPTIACYIILVSSIILFYSL